MPIQLGASETNANAIGREQIQSLHNHYKENTGKRRSKEDAFEPFDEKRDTRYGWFSLGEVLQFLTQNGIDVTTPGFDPGRYGLRLYFAQHDLSVYKPTPRDPSIPVEEYNNKDAIIIVLTIDDIDQLNDQQAVSIAAAATGLDNAKLCPPECSAGSIIV